MCVQRGWGPGNGRRRRQVMNGEARVLQEKTRNPARDTMESSCSDTLIQTEFMQLTQENTVTVGMHNTDFEHMSRKSGKDSKRN